jgi:alpha-L-fucosidase
MHNRFLLALLFPWAIFSGPALAQPVRQQPGFEQPPARFPYLPDGEVRPDRITVLTGADADRTGEFALASPVSHLKPRVINWKSFSQSLSWTVNVKTAADYDVTAMLNAKGVPLTLTIATDGSTLTSTFGPAVNGLPGVSLLDGVLHLTPGRHRIVLSARPTDPADANAAFEIEFQSLELATSTLRAHLHDEAMKMRSDARWMARPPFGVMFHWTKRTMPRYGPQKTYEDAVADFNVELFAKQVASTGAGFVVFTTAHSDQYIPAPNAALDAILPGRTAKRDLIADLIAALGKRHIKLMLYYHLGPIEDPAWSNATHMWDKDASRFFDNWQAIVGELGARYGRGLAGWWFDDGLFNYYYRSPDWAALLRAAKTGDTQRPVCFNSWDGARATEFQDYYCGEEVAPGAINHALNPDGSLHGTLKRDGDGRIAKGGYAGLQAVATFVLENDWLHTKRDQAAAVPKWTAPALAETLLKVKRYGGTPIINMLIYQDGTIPEKSLAILKQAAAIARKNGHRNIDCAGGSAVRECTLTGRAPFSQKNQLGISKDN